MKYSNIINPTQKAYGIYFYLINRNISNLSFLNDIKVTSRPPDSVASFYSVPQGISAECKLKILFFLMYPNENVL